MNNFLKKLFGKPNENTNKYFNNSNMKFIIKVDNLKIGYLTSKDNQWMFEYTDDFRKQDEYHRLVGFRDLNKKYLSDNLWPFFKIRIPGLKQPIVKEQIEKERLNIENEAELLKFFGRKSITNPYILELFSE